MSRSRYYAAAAPVTPIKRQRPLRPCPCGCGTRGLCDSHRERLAEIKAELAPNPKGLVARGYTVRGTRGVRKPSSRVPACANPECRGPRVPPEPFCDACMAAGFVDEDAAWQLSKIKRLTEET